MVEDVNWISEEIQVLSIHNIMRYKKYEQDQIERFIRLKQEEACQSQKLLRNVVYLGVLHMN